MFSNVNYFLTPPQRVHIMNLIPCHIVYFNSFIGSAYVNYSRWGLGIAFLTR